MDTLQAVKDYIAKEQAAGIRKYQEHEGCPQVYNDVYYHGYYNGYLEALYNLNLIITQAES